MSEQRPPAVPATADDKPPAPKERPWGARPPAPLGRNAAYQAVGEVAAPLLGGFSITLVGVIAQSPTATRWPGAALLSLTLAVGLLLFCVQAGFFARQLYWTKEDLAAWYTDAPTGLLEKTFQEMHRDHLEAWRSWIKRARRSFNAGIMFLALGLAFVLLPPEKYGADSLSASEAALRWTASALAAVLGAAEGMWWWRSSRRRGRP